MQNLNEIEPIVCSKQSFKGCQLNFSTEFVQHESYYSNPDRIARISFWGICNFDFNLSFKLGYQVEQA